jgi:hypothetical protein
MRPGIADVSAVDGGEAKSYGENIENPRRQQQNT